MDSFTVTEWLRSLNDHGQLSSHKFGFMIEQDLTKTNRLELLNKVIGLPIESYYVIDGLLFKIGNSSLSTYFQTNCYDLYSVRAEPKPMSDLNISHQRRIGITKEQCYEFVESLEPTKDLYIIKLNDYSPPSLVGTMIVNQDGVLIEAVEQRIHMALTQQWLSQNQIIRASLLFPSHRVLYTSQSTEIRKTLWEVIRAVMPDKLQPISPLHHPRLIFGYYEFSFSAEKGLRFFDFNQTSIFLSLTSANTAYKITWLQQPDDLYWLPVLEEPR